MEACLQKELDNQKEQLKLQCGAPSSSHPDGAEEDCPHPRVAPRSTPTNASVASPRNGPAMVFPGPMTAGEGGASWTSASTTSPTAGAADGQTQPAAAGQPNFSRTPSSTAPGPPSAHTPTVPADMPGLGADIVGRVAKETESVDVYMQGPVADAGAGQSAAL